RARVPAHRFAIFAIQRSRGARSRALGQGHTRQQHPGGLMKLESWFIGFAVAVLCHGVFAQSYPVRPVRIVVPATTGRPIDLIARSLAEKMSGSLGQPVIVEN